MSPRDTPREPAHRLVALGGAGARAADCAGCGKVWLVGAGPGDPDLLTIKALRVLQSADVVVHDRLTPAPILDMAGPRARLIDVGKRKSRHTLPQDDINRLLVALALDGLQVVRLKGGDPFVFGRGGEELAACREAGVTVEVVPGVTSALAAAAGAGAPLTHRGMAQAVTFVTGHAASGAEPDLDWAFLAKANHTVAVYMGVSTAPAIAARLIAAGRAAITPVLVVENASLLGERRALTTLAGLADALVGWDGPALLIIGEVAALAQVDGLVEQAQTLDILGETRMKALTANSLLSGDVVFWKDGAWVEQFADAQLFDGDEAAAAEAAGKAQTTRVVDVYLIDLAPTPSGELVPISYRERIRALGPTNHPQHGKQAQGGDVIDALAHASGAARSSGRLDLIRRK